MASRDGGMSREDALLANSIDCFISDALGSRLLQVLIQQFMLHEVQHHTLAGGQESGAAPAANIHSSDPDFTNQRETLQLISSYYRIPDSKVRAEVLSLLKTLGRPAES